MQVSESGLVSTLQKHRRVLISVIAVLALIGTLLVVREGVGSDDDESVQADAGQPGAVEGGDAGGDGEGGDEATGDAAGGGDGGDGSGSSSGSGGGGGGSGSGGGGSGSSGVAGGDVGGVGGGGGGPRVTVPGRGGASGTKPPGVTNKEITVAYYWKGDRTRTSPYLAGSGQEGNVDEALAFRNLIAYINKHANGGKTFMGFPFDLQGRKLKPVVLDAGQTPETYAQTAEALAKEVKPFAAVSSHGSLSAYICPRLAAAGIHNMQTYDLAPNLVKRTNGYCLPGGQSWDAQVERSIAFLAKQAKSSVYQGTAGREDRVYGLLYAEYPGLVEAVPALVKGLKGAGVPLAAVESISAELSTAQQQASSLVARFRAAGVNTLVMPDAGAPLNFTRAAQIQGYSPDYFVWPCSGQDTAGMVRLFDPVQWERASGLTCYDSEFNPDLTNDDKARKSEWYKQYQEVAGNAEPPAPTPLVYIGLLPLVVGITNAGPDLTVESFRAGMADFKPYRYSATKGRTTSGSSLLLTIGSKDGSPLGDVAKLEWSNTARTSGNAAQGAYVYPENRRYARGTPF